MIITFGPRQKAQDGTSLADRYVDLGTPPGHTSLSRLVAVRLFGTAWAFLYDTPEDAGASKYGLTEYKIPPGWRDHAVSAHRDDGPCGTCVWLGES